MNKRFKVLKDLTYGNPDYGIVVNLKKDVEYVGNPDLYRSLQTLYKSNIQFIGDVHFISNVPLEKCKNILVYRAGGIGDILFILPYLPKIKSINPEIKITFCTMVQNVPLLSISDYIDEIITDPIEYEKAISFDKIYNFIHFIEENPTAEHVNAYDIAESKEFFGIKRGDLVSNIEWKNPPLKFKNGEPFIHIMIQYSSSSTIREISPVLWWEFVTSLYPANCRITFVGNKPVQQGIKETIGMISKYSGIQVESFISIDLQSTMDYMFKKDPPHLFIGPDSGLTNLAGYHGIPTIGLYGPFPSDLRIKYYKNAIGIDVVSNCMFSKNERGNCFEHGIDHCPLSKLKDTQFSPCLELLNASDVIKAVRILLKEQYGFNMDSPILMKDPEPKT